VPVATILENSSSNFVLQASKFRTSHVTRHTSHVTRHTSHVTRHAFAPVKVHKRAL
jgi:hypothetical protein